MTLLTDERFADASLVFGGLSREQMAENRKFLEPLPEGAELLDPPSFVEPPRLRVFAAVATWGGLLLESLVALLCLIPAEGRIQVARHAAILVFCATTYALAPVAGFGWLIATMGLAQCRSNQRLLRSAYIARVRADSLVLGDPLDRGAGGVAGALKVGHSERTPSWPITSPIFTAPVSRPSRWPTSAAESRRSGRPGPPVPNPAQSQAATAPADPVWHYEGTHGPAHWATLSPKFTACGNGRSQSPIDIAEPTRWRDARS